MRTKFLYLGLILCLSAASWPASAELQIGERRRGPGTRLPNFGDIQRSSLDTMWEEFRADRERAAEHRPRLLVEETEKLAEHIQGLFGALATNDISEGDLNLRSEAIEKTTEQLRELINYGTVPPTINVAPLPEEKLEVRVRRLVSVTNRLIPNLLFLVGEDSYDLNLLNQIRSDLALTEALSRALPESRL